MKNWFVLHLVHVHNQKTVYDLISVMTGSPLLEILQECSWMSKMEGLWIEKKTAK